MFSELLLEQLIIANSESANIFVNDSNAYALGIDINELRNRFYKETGRVILNNENIKVLFEKEGDHLNFSTFDDVSIDVQFNAQRVAPNKGGDGFAD